MSVRLVVRSIPLWMGLATATFFLLGGDARVISRWAVRWVARDEVAAQRRIFEAQVLGPHGVPVLVAGLTSDDPQVVEASEQGMVDLLEAWQQLPPQESTVGVLAVAHELSEQAPRLSALGRPAAESIIRRLLQWPLPSPSSYETQLLSDCQRALDRLRPEPPADAEPSVAAIPSLPDARSTGGGAVATEPTTSQLARESLSGFADEESIVFPNWVSAPGGGISWNPVNVDALPLLPFFPAPLPAPQPSEPRRLDAPPVSRPPELFVPGNAQPLEAKHGS